MPNSVIDSVVRSSFFIISRVVSFITGRALGRVPPQLGFPLAYVPGARPRGVLLAPVRNEGFLGLGLGARASLCLGSLCLLGSLRLSLELFVVGLVWFGCLGGARGVRVFAEPGAGLGFRPFFSCSLGVRGWVSLGPVLSGVVPFCGAGGFGCPGLGAPPVWLLLGAFTSP